MNMVKTSKTLTILAAALLAAPVLTPSTVLAQSPTTRPGGAMGERRAPWERMDRSDNPGEPTERPSRSRYSPGREISDEQWEEITRYMREISPRRTAAYDAMTSPENKRLIRKLVTARYDYLQSIKREDPGLYEVQIDKTRAEDTIFGILQDVRDDKIQLGDPEKKALRDEVDKLIEANFKERQARIEKAQKSLQEASSRLEEDRKSKDSIVDERFNQYLREGARPLKMDRPDRSRRPDPDREGRLNTEKTPPSAAAD